MSDHRYYAAETSRAQSEWLQGKIELVRQKLQALKPQQPDDPDLLSFEWLFNLLAMGEQAEIGAELVGGLADAG